jgi:hypothetical protein
LKKLDFAQTVGLLANLGVIAGIVFLAFELQQNNELLEAQARSTQLNVRQSDSMLVTNNRDLANALIKNRNGDQLTEYEDLILTRYMEILLTGLQYQYNEMVSGSVDESQLAVEGWRSQFTGETLSISGHWPVLTEYWEASKFTYQPDFVQWMEENIVNER